MIWSRSDVKESEQYRLHLCESKEGNRFYRLVAIGSEEDKTPQEDALLITGPVPHDLLKRGDLISISETVPLNNGQPYFVEAHGMWLTEAEVRDMDANVNDSEIHWAGGRVPNFPPR